MKALSLILVTFLFLSPAQAQYGGGHGTEDDPYLIYTARQMNAIGVRPLDWDMHFQVMVDIDLRGFSHDTALIAPDTDSADGYQGRPFRGTFDGNGCTIRNLVISGESYVGLFGSLGDGACVRNLRLVNAEVAGGGVYIGILAGSNERGNISCCYTDGVVRGEGVVGGLVGGNGGTISHCYSASMVIAGDRVGGLAGTNSGSVVRSYSIGEVRWELPPGDWGEWDEWFIGGLIGWGPSYKVIDSFWDVEASRQTASAGGIGLTTSEMMDSYWYALNGWAGDPNWILDQGKDCPRLAYEATAGQPIPEVAFDGLKGRGTALDPYRVVTADQLFRIGRASILWKAHFVLCAELDLSHMTWSTAVIPRFAGVFDGRHFDIRNLTIRGENTLGLFGMLEHGAIVRNVGLVNARVTCEGSYAGTLAGYNYGDVTNCHGSGAVTSERDYAGGLVGNNAGSITGCFSASNVRGGSHSYSQCLDVGGLTGANFARVAHCYSTGAVRGYGDVGGLVGRNNGTVIQCYSTGGVSGKWDVGGLVGYGSLGSVTGSFWDTWTSYAASGAGGTGKPTREMRDPNTFMAAGWDFVNKSDGPSDIWAEPVGGGYPILWWQLSPLPELPTFSGGNGEPNAPYLITTADKLNSIGYNPRLMGAHFKLTADVDSGGSLFYPIGSGVYPYRGVFDGNGRTVSNLTYDCNGVDHVGLFGCVNDPNSQIKDLGLLNPCIDAGTGNYVGALVGHLKDGTVTGCYVEGGRVAGDEKVGGLVGVHGEADRSQSRPTISNCWSTGVVEGTGYVGGFAGENYGSITASYSASEVIGGAEVGGLVGRNYGGVTATYSTGTVMANQASVGGLVGMNDGKITTSCSTGSVSSIGGPGAGGLAGYNWNNGSITASYSTGAVKSTGWSVGGLVGYSGDGTVTGCYSIGAVSGEMGVGGLVGSNVDGIVTECFWDTETSGQATSDGGISEITADMQTAQTFLDAGWDFVGETANGTDDIWWILEGKDYPRLWWELPSDGFQVLVVDDFESYDDEDNRIWNTWVDGWFNGTGSQIGWEIWIETIVHSGSEAMPFQYNNVGAPYYSEVGRTWSPAQDWTVNGADSLVLHVRGTSTNDPAVLYVALEDSAGKVAVVPFADDTASTATNWLEWKIPLSSFAGVNLASVRTMYIGVGDRTNPVPGGHGIIYIDDIHLAQRMP